MPSDGRAPTTFFGATPRTWLELFVLGNVGFLAVDIYLAHSVNDFASRWEWLPFVYSLAAPALLAFGWARERGGHADGRRLAILVGAFGIAVGLGGMVLHLESAFFQQTSLHNLVYTAPFAAPLAYAGLGFLVLLSRLEDPDSEAWARWVSLFAWGGFVGNFVLALADHAQNGFFEWTEWIPVISAGIAVGFGFAVTVGPVDRRFVKMCAGVYALQIVVGVLGAALHTLANLERPGEGLEAFVYGAPALAPMLYADLAILGILALWALLRSSPPSPASAGR